MNESMKLSGFAELNKDEVIDKLLVNTVKGGCCITTVPSVQDDYGYTHTSSGRVD